MEEARLIGVNTNVLVRFLVQDDPVQSAQASELIERGTSNGQSILINRIVLCETIWVLETAYGFPRNEILDTVEKILQTAEFEIEDKDAAWQALQDSRQYQVDYSDSLIGRQNKILGCEHTATFEKKLRRLPTFKYVARQSP